MSYKALLGVLAVISFIALASPHKPGALEAALQAANSPPAFDDDEYKSIPVPENILKNQPIGSPIGATDPDNHTLRYYLSRVEDDAFYLESGTSQLMSNKVFDHERKPEYSGYVHVRDGKGGSDWIEIVVGVGNMDEPGTVSLWWDQPQVDTSVTATLSDPDGGLLA